jgi:hypothetical protein
VTSRIAKVALDRAFLDDLIALLKAHEVAESASDRAIARNTASHRYLSQRVFLLRETMRMRQNLEDQLSDATLDRPAPGHLVR